MARRLVITSPSHATHGGVESIVHDLCRELPRRGWDPVLALGKGARFNDAGRYRSAHADLPIVEVDGTRGTRQGRLEALAGLIASMRPDIVLSFRLFDAYHAAAVAKERRKTPRLAVAIRSCEPQYLFDARLYRSSIDLCVVDGNLLAAAAEDVSGLPRERVVSIPGGIRAPTVPRSARAPGGPLRVGYVGRFDQGDKRVLDVIDLVERLTRYQVPFLLDMVGSGTEESVLRARLARWTEQGTVRFRGWATTQQLYTEIYPNLDCLVHFSPAEGVTISPREGMVHGVVPVISHFVGLEAEGMFVHGTNALVFPVGDTAMAAARVAALATDGGLWARLSEAARHSQQGKYSFDGAMDLWARALDTCMERPPARGAVPALPNGDEGRLQRLGLSPWWAQRMRDLLQIRPVFDDAGSEWPHTSGRMTPDDAQRIMARARDIDGAARR